MKTSEMQKGWEQDVGVVGGQLECDVLIVTVGQGVDLGGVGVVTVGIVGGQA
jgi:hypothetical protein